MKKIFIFFFIFMFMAGTVWGKNFEITKKADDYTVKIVIDKNPPIIGENNIAIAIKDPSGKNVSGAKVKVEYIMPPMSGMPAMNYKTDATFKGNEYTSKLNFSMAGSWTINIEMAQGGKVRKAKLNVDVK